jgi:hypothetical protein
MDAGILKAYFFLLPFSPLTFRVKRRKTGNTFE